MKQPISRTQKTLNLWAMILIVWAIYRANFHLPEWFDELIAKPLVFVLPVWWFIVKKENRSFAAAVYLKSKKIWQDILLGLGIGIIFAASAILANYFKFNKLIFSLKDASWDTVLRVIFLALATGFSEEILSRGFVLKRLYDESHNILSASFFASILFFFLHVPILFTNPKMFGSTLLIFMTTDLLLSLINSFVFLERKSLFLPILIHAFYNIVMTLFY